MTQIICLANSKKLGGRCLAGIDIETREWIRPVSDLEHQEITWTMRQINGNEPNLLDVIDIPLQGSGDDIGCQPENRLLDQGNWQLVKQLAPADISIYYESDDMILHNHDNSVPFVQFSNMSSGDWKSLQLIHNNSISFRPYGKNNNKWKAHFKNGSNIDLDLPITDPVIVAKLNAGQTISNECIMTISLGGPLSGLCYKLAAGIIEL